MCVCVSHSSVCTQGGVTQCSDVITLDTGRAGFSMQVCVCVCVCVHVCLCSPHVHSYHRMRAQSAFGVYMCIGITAFVNSVNRVYVCVCVCTG